jgi:eukaryotic-like serine/threonine-protein kinase
MTDPRARELSEVAAALGAQYDVERELGRGGMGVVYLARDRMLDRMVAVKTLPWHLTADDRVRERFVREARTAARLSHPNIVPIHRADEMGGVVFFVMGYVDGESLADRVRERGPLPAGEVVRLLRDVADALDAAHRRGVVHRDVKSENILIDRTSGAAMVTDFGIARVAEAAPMTATGMVLGSVHYISPEQALGEAIDARSDIYSLGVVAFHALTGRFPFESESASALVVAHVTRQPPPVRSFREDLPEPLAEVVDRCLAKDPAARFESARALCDRLDALLRDRTVVPLSVAAPSAPVLRERVSDADAAAIFERAARLAEGTRSEAAPLARPAAPTGADAYDLATVRESAREAGIATQAIDRAIAEHAGTASGVMPIEDRSRRPNPFVGSPTHLEYEVVVDGEVPEREFDRLVETMRRVLGDVGLVTMVGRSLGFSSTDRRRNLNVSVAVRGGRTTIRASERMTSAAGGVFGPIMGAGGGGLGGAVFGSMMGATHGDALIALPAWGSTILLAYGVARFTFGRVVRGRRTALREVTERLADEARALIAATTDTGHRLR